MRIPAAISSALLVASLLGGCRGGAVEAPTPEAPVAEAELVEPVVEAEVVEAEVVEAEFVEPEVVEPEVVEEPLQCGRTAEQERALAERMRACHPHEHPPIDLAVEEQELNKRARKQVAALAAKWAGDPGTIILKGGAQVELVRSALIESGVFCDKVLAVPDTPGRQVSVTFVCAVCCLL